MIKIYKPEDFKGWTPPANGCEFWDFPLDELPYLAETYPDGIYVLYNERLYELDRAEPPLPCSHSKDGECTLSPDAKCTGTQAEQEECAYR